MASTAENIIAAIAGEHYENSEMYPEFADVADEEGLDDVAVKTSSNWTRRGTPRSKIQTTSNT